MTFNIITTNRRFSEYAQKRPVSRVQTSKGRVLEIRRKFGELSSDKHYCVYSEGREVATARLYGIHGNDAEPTRGVAFVSRVQVEQNLHRQGIATALYDLIESDLHAMGADLQPSEAYQLSDDATAFWTARIGENPADFHKRQFAQKLRLFVEGELARTNEPLQQAPARGLLTKIVQLARLKFQRHKLQSMLNWLKQ